MSRVMPDIIREGFQDFRAPLVPRFPINPPMPEAPTVQAAVAQTEMLILPEGLDRKRRYAMQPSAGIEQHRPNAAEVLTRVPTGQSLNPRMR